MPRCASGDSLSVPMSIPRYTAVESHATISPPNASASASASALLPVAVGPTTATAFVKSANPLVVEERHREWRDRIERVGGRQDGCGIRLLERVEGRRVERGDAGALHD